MQKKGELTDHCDWMAKLPPELHSTSLWNIVIPGSHDSMSYDLNIDSAIVEPDKLRKYSQSYYARKLMYKWAITQEETITRQLDAGVRYFDLRIARKPHDPDPTRLYFHHGLITLTDVETVLQLINDWAERHSKEIIILAFSHFKGFDSGTENHLHSHLIKLIKTLFGAKLFLRTDVPTLKSCWEKGRNIIVSYDHHTNRQPEIWGRITYYYGDTMDPAKVQSKLCHILEKQRPSNCFFVCGLNLTLPSDNRALKYILRRHDTLPKFIRRSQPELVEWMKRQAGKTSMNIVASDLVTCNDFVSTVIALNILKHAES